MSNWSATQFSNAYAALEVVRARKLDNVVAQQVLAGMITECSLWNYANPLYPYTLPYSDGYPPKDLAPSTKESCGVFQQRPHIPVWWGPDGATIVEQALYFMDVRRATGLFLDRLVKVPRTLTPWREIQAVQGSEYDGIKLPYAENYQSNWVAAGELLATIPVVDSTITEWITMTAPDQGALDKYADEITAKVVNATINETNVADLLYNGRHYTADAIADYTITSQVDGKDYPLKDFLVSIDRKLSEILTKLP